MTEGPTDTDSPATDTGAAPATGQTPRHVPADAEPDAINGSASPAAVPDPTFDEAVPDISDISGATSDDQAASFDPTATAEVPANGAFDPARTADVPANGAPDQPDGDVPGPPLAALQDGPLATDPDATGVLSAVAPPVDPTVTAVLPLVGAPLAGPPPAPESAPGPVGSAVGPGSPPEPGSPFDRPSPAMAAAAAISGTPIPAGSGRRPHRSLGLIPKLSIAGLVVVAGLVTAWGLDQARTDGEVVRNTTLAGRSVAGLDRAGLEGVLADLDQGLSSVEVAVSVNQSMVGTNAAALGARIDHQRVITDALDAHRQGNVLLRPLRWVASFFGTQPVDVRYTVDPAVAQQAADTVVTPSLDQPVAPDLIIDNGQLAVSPGHAGVEVKAQQIIDTLPPVLFAQQQPYQIALDPVPTEPRFGDDQIQQVADEANRLTNAPVTFKVLDQSADVDPKTIRQWIDLDASADTPTWAIDTRQALDDLARRFPRLGSEDQRAHFTIVDGKPQILPATESVICCTEASVAALPDALRQAPPGSTTNPTTPTSPTSPPAKGADKAAGRTVTLEPMVVGPDQGAAELGTLGIVEEVSTFTTKHPCCQNRVKNIHRIADIVRGVVIRPGENFSINGYVGERTIEKGFVADHAIVDGVLEDQVGGGVSQFATTFFNASFFGGLDFNEYQSHSLYISRYPKGREATVSWKKPDLSVKNTTGYGILVWTAYTDTSLTVTFYSTKHIDVVSGDPVASPQGQCTRYTTSRSRTYSDGRKVQDSVFALYRPAEGLDCNGNSTRPDGTPQGPTIVDPGSEPTAPGAASTATPTTTPTPTPDTTPAPPTTVAPTG